MIVSVKDQGIGMTQIEVEHVFDAESTQTKSKLKKMYMNPMSNKIGLSICKQICHRLGGEILVKSVPNNGSTFVFSMPVFFATELN